MIFRTRRGFLKFLSAGLSSVFFGGRWMEKNQIKSKPLIRGPRKNIPNPYTDLDGRPILVSIEGKDFHRMLERGLNVIGGLSRLISGNEDVLVKPNFSESSVYPWVSSRESIAAIIKEVKKVTNGTVNVGDMSFEKISGVYRNLDLKSVVEGSGGHLRMFNKTYRVRRESWPAGRPDFEVFSDVYDAPVIINTPVLKRHILSGMTCALKCNIGAVKGSAATHTRGYIHFRSPSFLAEIAETAGLINPELNIVDARSIVTRFGPVYSILGRKVDTDKIIICGDMLATEAYCARLMEAHDPHFSISKLQETWEKAEQLGLGTSDLNSVEIIEVSA
jgi:uncharacterized protein (DUF362 family)